MPSHVFRRTKLFKVCSNEQITCIRAYSSCMLLVVSSYLIWLLNEPCLAALAARQFVMLEAFSVVNYKVTVNGN